MWGVCVVGVAVLAGGSEEDRVRVFEQRHKHWPPDWEHDFNSPVELAARESELMQMGAAQYRWNKWMEFVQERLIANHTVSGFSRTRLPSALHARVWDGFQKGFRSGKLKDEWDRKALSGEPSQIVHMEDDVQEALRAHLQPLQEEWCQCKLEFQKMYGVRVYRNGSALECHLDNPSTHVISTIVHVAHDAFAPWPLQIRDHFGRWHTIPHMEPGDVLQYESAKCRHCRSTPLLGRYYANVFVHWRPVKWGVSTDDVVHAVPPHWMTGLAAVGGPPADPTYSTEAYRSEIVRKIQQYRAARGVWDRRMMHVVNYSLAPEPAPTVNGVVRKAQIAQRLQKLAVLLSRSV